MEQWKWWGWKWINPMGNGVELKLGGYRSCQGASSPPRNDTTHSQAGSGGLRADPGAQRQPRGTFWGAEPGAEQLFPAANAG